MVKHWQKRNSYKHGDFRVFQVREDESVSPRTGRAHQFYILEADNWANIIPVTKEGNVVLIHQYRHGTERVEVEIPGGVVDPTDESPLVGAERELLEETGYTAEKIIQIGEVAPNPAILDNRCYTFLALGAVWQRTPEFDGSEDIVVEEVPLVEIPSLIQTGKISHALVVAGFYFFEQYRREHPDWFE